MAVTLIEQIDQPQRSRRFSQFNIGNASIERFDMNEILTSYPVYSANPGIQIVEQAGWFV